MKILLVQIGDIHIKGPNCPALLRLRKIAQAVRHLDSKIDAAVMVLSGDIAFSGRSEEYAIAGPALQAAVSDLSALLKGPPVHLFGVPGNHDCKFTHPMAQARKLLLESLARSSTEIADENTLQLCCSVQDDFFAFLDSHQTMNPVHNVAKAYYEYLVPMGGGNILFRCFNTAFSSMLPENAGQMVYPLSLLKERPITPAPVYTVAVLHHPYNWFSPNVKRALGDHLEHTCDVIFTGHEHATAYYKKEAFSGLVTNYIEGAVFQDHGSDDCGFNLVLVDLSTFQERVYFFGWSTDHFAQEEITDGWRPFRRGRARGDFELTDRMLEHLQDPGATFTHPAKPRLLLEDIYVPPNAQELTFREGVDLVRKGNIASKDLLNFIANKHRMLIIGKERSGKTTLAKVLFRQFYAKEYVPVLVEGDDI